MSSDSNTFSWIERSIELQRAGEIEQALDVIFDNLDELLQSSKYEQCSFALASLPVGRLTDAQLLTALTATAPARHQLPGRKPFFSRVERTLTARGVDVERLLSGLQ